MTAETISVRWSERFGLARSPMFEGKEHGGVGEHESFLMGVTARSAYRFWRKRQTQQR
jgi:hypothetical protein